MDSGRHVGSYVWGLAALFAFAASSYSLEPYLAAPRSDVESTACFAVGVVCSLIAVVSWRRR